jgi:hypothetical protein
MRPVMILGAGLMLVGLAAAIPACGGGDEGDDDDGSGSTSGSPSGSGSGNQSSNAASSGESSSSSGQTCRVHQRHLPVHDAGRGGHTVLRSRGVRRRSRQL